MSLLRARLSNLELEYETNDGSGELVLLIHGGAFAPWFRPLAAEPALAQYRLVRPHRAGYAGSDQAPGSLSIGDQAAHARALVEHLGLGRVHVVGHSSGASIALQLALDAPGLVGSLTLLEPVLMQVPTGPIVGEALARYNGGDAAGAIAVFLRGVCGPGSMATIERVLPDALHHVATDAAAFFGQELPALRGWQFGPEQAARIDCPILAVLGAESDAARLAGGGGARVFAERHELLVRWLPQAEGVIMAGVTHLMLLENPSALAELLASFFIASAEQA